MKKNHNRRRQNPPEGNPRLQKNRQNLKKLGLLFLNFVLFYALLRILITLGEYSQQVWIYYTATVIYGIAACGTFIGFFVLNGFQFENRNREWDELPDKWSDEQKQAFMDKQPENRAKAKNLIYILMPIVVTLAISFVELYFIK